MGPLSSTPPSLRLVPRRGMAMVLVLILIVVMSLGAMAVFVRSSGELSTTSNLRAQAEAWTVAQAGIERYLIVTTTTPTTFPSTSTYTFSNGTATVTLDRVRAGAVGRSETYVLRSVGTVVNRRTGATVPSSSRTLTQIVQRQTSTLDVDAAFVSLSGLNKNGSSGMVSGVDECATAPTLPGLSVPNGMYTPGSNSPSANNYIDGAPDNAPAYLGPAANGNTAGSANEQVRIPWQGVLDGTSLQPDFTINRSVSPNTGSFPTTTQYANWPVVRVTGNLSQNEIGDGRGILIVTGNASFGNINWQGVVLVGGEVTLNGATTIKGALVSGLNKKISPLSSYPYLPQTYPGVGGVGNGNFQVRYNSCNVSSALGRFTGWLRLANTWTDNWPAP